MNPRLRTFRRLLLSAALALTPPSAAADELAVTRALVFNCFTCHGTNGRSPGAIHSINGKSAKFLRSKLAEFKTEQNSATIMNRIARGYSDEEIARIAAYLADMPP